MGNNIEIKIDNQEVNHILLDVASKCNDLRPLMKNIAGIMACSVEENFKEEGRPEKWIDLSESTKKQRKKSGHYPGQILQVTGQLASSITTNYDENSATIGSNLDYAAIHQLGGLAGKKQSINIPARPYLILTDVELSEIINNAKTYISHS